MSAKAQDVAGASARDRFDLGMAYREMGLVDSAVAEFEGACSDPQWESRARVMLGALRVLQGDIDVAVSDLLRASATASTDEEQSSAAYELAVVYEKAGDSAAAIELFEGITAGFRERDAKLASLRG
ncbi:MAG: tetratricopeptide repeat protein [Nannocystaceae bacterium]|nr:tetratricopeptide repeat protein [Nannocystaceae bacterium]